MGDAPSPDAEANLPDHLFRFVLGGEAHGQVLDYGPLEERLRGDALAWVHLEAVDESIEHWLREKLGYLDDFVVEALLAPSTRSRVVEVGSGLLVILKGANYLDPDAPEDMVAIRAYIDPHRIISVEKRESRSIREIAQELSAGRGPRDAAGFLTELIINLNEQLEEPISSLSEAADKLEDHIFDGQIHGAALDLERGRIMDVRSQAVQFRRHLAPQRDAVLRLAGNAPDWFSKKYRRRLAEEGDELTRFVEDLDGVRDRMMAIKDEHQALLSQRLNRNLYVLSILSAVFLPATFLTGLFGINVGGMPGADNPAAFWVFSGAMAVLIAFLVWIFRRLDWF